MSEHYLEHTRKFLDFTSFEEFFTVFIDCQIKISAVAKINSCEVNILLPEGMTKEIILNLENLILSEIKKQNPEFTWESKITTYDKFRDVYSLCLYNIFY